MAFFSNSAPNIRVMSLVDWLNLAVNGPLDLIVDARIVLPMIQRGFIWKPGQIIDLWDTLLRGMPIGSLMASELPSGYQWFGLLDRKLGQDGDCIGLIDGQQRTLAMLIGWIEPAADLLDRRLWVDFADEPDFGHLLRMRITTPNQPFGFQRESPDTKLPLGTRRRAQAEDLTRRRVTAEDQRGNRPPRPDFRSTKPWCDRASLPMDMRELVFQWRLKADRQAYEQTILSKLQTIGIANADRAKDSGPIWERVKRNVARLADGLDRIWATEIPVLRVDGSLFRPDAAETGDEKSILEPPLAVLFKRIGANGTELSNDDYAYSILKQIVPDVHATVESLYNLTAGVQVARLMSATDLVMTGLRLAAAAYDASKKVGDPVRPSKEEFHRLINRDRFLDETFLPLLRGDLRTWFGSLLSALQYDVTSNPLGLPKYLFPHLGRTLVQVLLRLGQIGYICAELSDARRRDLLRLCLYWLVCVSDGDNPSRIAYQFLAGLASDVPHPDDLGYRIAQKIVTKGYGVALEYPEDLKAYPGLAFVRSGADKLVGESRFSPGSDQERDRALCRFYRNHWWRPWTYRHPLLLWLQRAYVEQMPGEPLAGRDEDTPYDYDHILPGAHWSYWTGTAGSTSALPFHCDNPREYGFTGNGIGNVRVWDASDNRSDSDKSPTDKLHGTSTDRYTVGQDILTDSAIDQTELKLWERCSKSHSQPADIRYWDQDRALAFQQAVETRAFKLYERFFNDMRFQDWPVVVGVGAPDRTQSSPAVSDAQPPGADASMA